MNLSSCAVLLLCVAAVPLAAQSAQPDYASAMMRAHGHETPTASPAARIAPRAAVVGSEVTYGTVDGKALRGYLARPAAATPGAPAIVLIHEWWGLNDNIRAVADRYAGEGYVVLAVDMFGRSTTLPDTAMVLYQAAMANVPLGEKNVGAAIAYLKANGATKIGAIGFCFGGHWSLRTGLVGGRDINAVVIYYGAPISDSQQLARLKAPVLGLYGARDNGIPADSVNAMSRKLTASGARIETTFYPEAHHGFANPSGESYDEVAAKDAWRKSLVFFQSHLR
jgi:carboxymethylenebutenolidase